VAEMALVMNPTAAANRALDFARAAVCLVLGPRRQAPSISPCGPGGRARAWPRLSPKLLRFAAVIWPSRPAKGVPGCARVLRQAGRALWLQRSGSWIAA